MVHVLSTMTGNICHSSYVNIPTKHFSLKAARFIFKSVVSSFFICFVPPLPLALFRLTYVYIASIYCVFSFVKCWHISFLPASERRRGYQQDWFVVFRVKTKWPEHTHLFCYLNGSQQTFLLLLFTQNCNNFRLTHNLTFIIETLANFCLQICSKSIDAFTHTQT